MSVHRDSLGSLPALLASILAMLCFNFFFLPPFGTPIAATDNWIALLAFLITAVTAGQLSGRAKRRAEEAELAGARSNVSMPSCAMHFNARVMRRLCDKRKLKSALLDAVTHDLRTPLTSIKASITTLLDEVRGGEPPATLDRDSKVEMMEVIDEGDRLSRFINGLIELARIEAGELQLRRRWGVVDEIISTALQRAEPITRNHRVELQVEKELPGVRVDERAVSEVVYTLIDNAASIHQRIHHSPDCRRAATN